MDMIEHKISSVPQFLEEVQRYPSSEWVYRGQANAQWPLIPKAGRPEYFDSSPPSPRRKVPCLNRDLDRFESWCRQAIAYHPDLPQKPIERLALAQHYWLATRLLDWTRNPLVALYFAAESHGHVDGAVYCYLSVPSAIAVDTKELPRDEKPRAPYNVGFYEPPPFDRRILAQAGCFTYHLDPSMELIPQRAAFETSDAPEGVDLVRFVLAGDCKIHVLAHLSDIGVNRRTLFPDLEGLSHFVNWETRRLVSVNTSET